MTLVPNPRSAWDPFAPPMINANDPKPVEAVVEEKEATVKPRAARKPTAKKEA